MWTRLDSSERKQTNMQTPTVTCSSLFIASGLNRAGELRPVVRPPLAHLWPVHPLNSISTSPRQRQVATPLPKDSPCTPNASQPPHIQDTTAHSPSVRTPSSSHAFYFAGSDSLSRSSRPAPPMTPAAAQSHSQHLYTRTPCPLPHIDPPLSPTSRRLTRRHLPARTASPRHAARRQHRRHASP